MPVDVRQWVFVRHDYISFDGFRKSWLFSGLFFDLDCVLAMLLYTRQNSAGFPWFLGREKQEGRFHASQGLLVKKLRESTNMAPLPCL